ncbi:ORFC4 [Zebra finch circovirus]|uniref:ORFC4 n=1 Tax=Zebra finch circovirus TaxID=1642515 RepID=A0A142LXX3_9CIRC|nr:ORFC4 [Zebra finch circovirus]
MADHRVLPWSAFGRPGTLTGQLWGCEAWPTRRSNLARGWQGPLRGGHRAARGGIAGGELLNS